MSHFLPDLIADPKSFVVGTFSVTVIADLVAGMKAAFIAGGWTLIINGSGVGEANVIIFESQQSPWWDHSATPPSSYVAKIRFGFFSEAGSIRGQLRDVDGTLLSSPSAYTMLTFNAGQTYHYNVCPFQAVFKDLGGGPSLIVCVPHTSKFEQEAGLENLAIMLREFHIRLWQTDVYFGQSGWVYTKNAAGTFSHNAHEAINDSGSLTLCLYYEELDRDQPTGIYNRSVDPTMTDSSLWFPFISPAVLAFSDSFGPPRARGWFWNGLVIGKGFAPDKIITIGGVTLQGFTDNNFGGGGGVSGTLFFVTARN